MTIDLELDTNKVKKRIDNRLGKVQFELDSQVLKDSNFYAPDSEGFLIDSGIISSKLGTGVLIWNTPYATAQYYGLPNKSTDKNPNASMKWFEVAKSKRKGAWEKLSNRVYAA